MKSDDVVGGRGCDWTVGLLLVCVCVWGGAVHLFICFARFSVCVCNVFVCMYKKVFFVTVFIRLWCSDMMYLLLVFFFLLFGIHFVCI